jgi:hypothetical protein
MKRIIIGAGVLVIVGIIGFLLMHKKSAETFVAAPTEVKKEGYSILLYPKSGDVMYATDGVQFVKVVDSPTEINNNTVVKTGTGTAIVLLPDNSSISLNENTEITINYSPQKTSIIQTLGTTYHRVEALVKGGSYEVKTPGTLAAVRGTKFGVKYDPSKKKTKISVTEHMVEVKKDEGENATTTGKEEVVKVEEGKTVAVEEKKDTKGEKKMAMVVIETIKDTDMKQFVDKERIDDRKIDEMKRTLEEQQKNTKELEQLDENNRKDLFKEMFRKEMKKEILKDEKNEKEEKNIREIIKEPTLEKKVLNTEENKELKEVEQKTTEEVKTIAPVTKTVTTDTTKTVTNTTVDTSNTSTSGGTVTKMDEEKFYSTFEPLFIKHFYLDDTDTPCTTGAKASDKVKAVMDYAKNSGYPFTSATLGDFAQQIDTYCSTKDKTLKTRLQTRFDDEYPFQ